MNHKNTDLPVIKNLYELYKTFSAYCLLFPKKNKYTIGSKCETYIINAIELTLEARYTTKEEKIMLLKQANIKLDILKLFIRLLKDSNAIDGKKYIFLQKQIQEIGAMLGGWKRSLN